MEVERRLEALRLKLPPAPELPNGLVLPFSMVRIVGERALVSGHGPQGPDGRLAGPFGKVGAGVTPAQAQAAAALVALSMLGSLRRALGDLDRISGWLRVYGMVNAAPGFTDLPQVINGFSELILAVFGPEIGQHARSAVGQAELPWNIPVEIEAEVLVRPA